MPAPLVSGRWRAPALVAVAVSALAVLSFGLAMHDATRTAFDDWAFRAASGHLATQSSDWLLYSAKPSLSFTVIALVAVAGALSRRWAVLALAVTGPGVAVILTEYVLKPIIHRTLSVPGLDPAFLREVANGAYPSGHETGVASAAVLALVAAGQLPLRRVGRVVIVTVLAGWTALGAVALVRNGYHYATDTFGSIGLSFAVVVGFALLLDTAARRVRPRQPQLT